MLLSIIVSGPDSIRACCGVDGVGVEVLLCTGIAEGCVRRITVYVYCIFCSTCAVTITVIILAPTSKFETVHL